jgi:hypothetical protein
MIGAKHSTEDADWWTSLREIKCECNKERKRYVGMHAWRTGRYLVFLLRIAAHPVRLKWKVNVMTRLSPRLVGNNKNNNQSSMKSTSGRRTF